MQPVKYEQLADVFDPKDLEWRVQRSGVKGDKPWAFVLTYVTNRAIMQRLDEVCGPENWRNEYAPGPDGGVVCGLSIRCAVERMHSITGEICIVGEWVTKYDGAPNTDIEQVKGGLSGAMKRAAVQWGIGRYLYGLESNFAKIYPGGEHRDCIKPDKKKNNLTKNLWFNWDPPDLPAWALPTTSRKPVPEPPPHEPEPGQDAPVEDYTLPPADSESPEPPAADPEPAPESGRPEGDDSPVRTPKQKKMMNWLYTTHKEAMETSQRETIHSAIVNDKLTMNKASELISFMKEKWGMPARKGE